MGRHQRRGYVGQTNLPSPHKHAHHNTVERGPLQPPPDQLSGNTGSSPTFHSPTRKRQLRAKWKLDLAPVPRALEGLHDAKLERLESDTPESVLASNIESVQHDRKSFKDEPWYRSPIGAGSKSSVILAALKQQDHSDSGFLPRESILSALQHRQFGLSEQEIHKLLARYDPTQDQIHYKTFVQHLHFSEPLPTLPDDHDIIFRHQTYLEKVRDHAARLLDKANPDGASSPTTLRLSPIHREMVTNHEPSVVLGNSPTHSPSRRLLPLTEHVEPPSPTRCDVMESDDRLSFEYDKQRRVQRAQVKAATLLAHISRIDAYARRQDAVAVQQDSLRIAHKALHHGEHLARVFDEQHRQLHRLENQGRALVDSPQRNAQRTVSKDSMFYVDPNGG